MDKNLSTKSSEASSCGENDTVAGMSEISAIQLVADIGGTNLRIGTVNSLGTVDNLKTYQCAEYQGLLAIIEHYTKLNNLSDKCINACFAIACPVDNDEISMTNLPWRFRQSELKKALNLNKLFIINDYTAIAHAVPYLSDKQKVKIGSGKPVTDKPISICGPGTGLGVANIVFNKAECIVISGEGGM